MNTSSIMDGDTGSVGLGSITVTGMSTMLGGHNMLPPPSVVLSSTVPGPAPNTVGEMGPPPPDPVVNVPGGQQAVLQAHAVRARVTVVCMECKRLKLKCDRRIPCGSCSKRDTVERCVYSPAAAEKVDVQSLHNRLSVVESNLTNLPSLIATAIATSLPQHGLSSVGPDGSSTSGLSKGSNVLAIDPNGASVLVNIEGATGLWLGLLSSEPNTGLKPVDSATPSDSGIQESPAMDTASAAGILARHAGLTNAILSPRTAQAFPHSVLGQHLIADGQTTAEQDPLAPVVPHLISRLPGSSARANMLSRLEAVFIRSGVSTVQLSRFRARVETLGENIGSCSPASPVGSVSIRGGKQAGAGKRKEKAPKAVKGKGKAPAKGIRDPDKSDKSREKELHPSLSFIAAAAAALAIGARCWLEERESGISFPGAPSGSAEPEVMDSDRIANSSERGGSIETGFGSSDNDFRSTSVFVDHEVHGSVPEALYRLSQTALALHLRRHGAAALDLDYIHAQTLCIRFLLLCKREGSHLSVSGDPIIEAVHLVGGLVAEARLMGLGVDPDDVLDVRLDWQSLKKGPLVNSITGSIETQLVQSSSQATTTDSGNIALKHEDGADKLISSQQMSIYTKEMRRRLWWEIVWLDFTVHDMLGQPPLINDDDYSTMIPSDVDDDSFMPTSTTLPAPKDETPQNNISFFLQRSRLVYLMKSVLRKKPREFRLSLLNEQDFDSARALAAEIDKYLSSIPERFRLEDSCEILNSCQTHSPPMGHLPLPAAGQSLDFSPMDSTMSPRDSSTSHTLDSNILIAQRCELGILARHTLLRLFLPFLRPESAEKDSPVDSSVSPRMLAGSLILGPSSFVIQATQAMRAACRQIHPDPSSFVTYPLARALFDAAVVAAQTSSQQSMLSFVLQDVVRSAITTLKSCTTCPETCRSAALIVEKLLCKAEDSRKGIIAIGSKRKRNDTDTSEGFQPDFKLPFVGASVVRTNASEESSTSSSPEANPTVVARNRASDSPQASTSRARTANGGTENENRRPKAKSTAASSSVSNRVQATPRRDNQSRSRANSTVSSRQDSQVIPINHLPQTPQTPVTAHATQENHYMHASISPSIVTPRSEHPPNLSFHSNSMPIQQHHYTHQVPEQTPSQNYVPFYQDTFMMPANYNHSMASLGSVRHSESNNYFQQGFADQGQSQPYQNSSVHVIDAMRVNGFDAVHNFTPSAPHEYNQYQNTIDHRMPDVNGNMG